MGKPTVDDVLVGSKSEPPASIALNAALDSLVVETQAASEAQRSKARRRNLWLVPTVAAGALALTAGAVLFTPNFDPDVRIPIEYVTDADETVSCTYALRVGSVIGGENPELREWVLAQDWTGVGQRIYDDAIAHPYVPDVNVEGEFTQERIDSVSWFTALDRQIIDQIPADLTGFGDEIAGASNCTGQLH